MPIKMELQIEESSTFKGTFDADITYIGNGRTRVSLVLSRKSIIEAVKTAMEPILVIAPNATQEEVDEHYKLYP